MLQELVPRPVSLEDQRQGASGSRAPSKTTFNELLDTLKLLEEEPGRLPEPKCYRKEKYSWIDEARLPSSVCNEHYLRDARNSFYQYKRHGND